MDKTRRNHQHQIFVASSLELQDKRDAVTEAVAEYNKNHPGTYSCIRYEKDITQCVDKKSAQREVNNFLVKSPIFFLIAEQNKIKEKSEKEFELALEHFRNEELPRFIFIFNSGTEKDILTEKGENLLKKYGLNDYRIDSHGELITYPQVYYIPFSDTTGLKDRILEQLERLPKRLPPTKAKLGSQLVKEDFYTDHNRLNKFPSHYYPRQSVDDAICDAIKTQRMVLVTGLSLNGKTRSVMEALRKVDDGWVHVIGDSKNGLVEELKILENYLRIDNHVKLYVEIDNLDQLVAEEDFRKSMRELVSLVMQDDKATIVATSSNPETVGNALSLDKNNSFFSQIEIPQLTKAEFHNAIAWFKSCGDAIVTNGNRRYLQIGALFVNLSELKTRYDDFLRTNTVVRQALLKAIKAQSIWRDDAFGDKDLLESMTKYFAQNGKNEPQNFRSSVYQEAIRALCGQGKLGVTKSGNDNPGSVFNKQLHIEEYVYQYVIGYNGKPVNSDSDYKDQVVLEEELIQDIILYCINQREKKSDSSVGKELLTRQVSRIIRRCDHPRDVVPWLFNMWWNGEENGDSGLAEKLKEDRETCEKSHNSNDDHFYAGIVKEYFSIMTKYEKTFNLESCLQVYDAIPEAFRHDELFAKLIRVAKTPEEKNKIRKHKDYNTFSKKPVSVMAEMDWYNDYNSCRNLFDNVENPCKNKMIRNMATEMLNTGQKPYDIFFYGHLLRKLAQKAHTQKDFDNLVPLLCKNFVCLLSDRKVLEKIKNRQVPIINDKLTLIDLFLALEERFALPCAKNVFGGNIQSCEKLEQDLLDCVRQTLDNKLTTELEVRMVVSRICTELIRTIAKDSDYEDVYEELFAPLEMNHPVKNGQKIIFRNVFTYTAMMECRNIDVQTSMNLFTNDLLRHAKDVNNPLSVTSYTLNMMLKNCFDEKSSYIDQINDLYDLLGLKRELYTYNILINAARDLPSVRKILETIKGENLTPDLYTYLNILWNKDIDFQEAARVLDVSDCEAEEYTLPDIFLEIGITSEIQRNLHSMRQTWICLFKKNADGNQTAKTLKHCLKHLREEHPDLLEDGRIYNTLLENNSFFQDLKHAVDYIEKELKPFGFKPDSYTAKALLTKVHALKGIDQLGSIGTWNKFITKHPECLNQKIIAQRITLFRKQDDQLEFTFFDKNQKPVTKTKFSPLGYLRQLVLLEIPIDAPVVCNYLEIKNIRTEKTYHDIAEQLSLQHDKGYYTPTAEDIRTVRERILPYCEMYELPDVYSYSRMTSKDYNKSLSWNYKVLHPKSDTQNIIRSEMGKAETEVRETLNMLKWDDVNSAMWALTEILDTYVENMREGMKGGIWSVMMNIYETFITNRQLAPTSFIFTLLAKSLTKHNTDEDRQWLFNKLREHSNKVIISPHVLGELARSVNSVEKLIQQTEAIRNLGCKPNALTADTYVFWLNRNLMKTDKDKVTPILNDLLQYFFEDEIKNDSALLQKENYRFLLLDTYLELFNISPSLLQTLLSFNEKIEKYTKQDLAKKIESLAEKVKETRPNDNTVSNLMTRLVKDTMLRNEYIPIFFDRPRKYSTKVLLYLTSPEQLPAHDIKKYNELIRKFYKFNCPIPESVVPNLLDCLADYDGDPEITEEQKKQITKRLTNVYINITLNHLRQGDLIMEDVTLVDREHVEWCHPSLDCLTIHELFDKKKRNIYPTLLKLYKLNKDFGFYLDFDKNRKPFKALYRAEGMYAFRIREWETSLTELSKLPNLWNSISWIPSKKLLLTIIGAYFQQPYQCAQYIVDMSTSLSNAQQYFTYFGRNIPTDELKKILPHSFIVDLCCRKTNPRQYTANEYNQTKYKEKIFTKELLKGEINPKPLDNLPLLLTESNWKPNANLILTLICYFGQTPDMAARQITELKKNIDYAERNNYPKVPIGYGSLVSHPIGTDKCILIEKSRVLQVMPHGYIISLCFRVSNRSNDGKIKLLELDYIGLVRNGAVSQEQLRRLPYLWEKAKNWKPSEELRKLVNKCDNQN